MHRSNPITAPFNTVYFRSFYTGYRDKFDDLFRSEQRFLPKLIDHAKTLLDVGCAIGGLYKIISSIKPEVEYTGVDVSKSMIKVATQDHPNTRFLVADGAALPFNDNTFDSVVSLGTTVHDPAYMEVIRECYRVARTAVLFDIRLIRDMPTVNDVAKGHVDDGAQIPYPYVVVNADEFIDTLKKFPPMNISIYGYWGKPNDFTTLPQGYNKVCMCGVLLEKADLDAHVLDLNAPVWV